MSKKEKREPVVVQGFMVFARYLPAGEWSAYFNGSEDQGFYGPMVPEKHFGFKVYRASFVVPDEFKPPVLAPQLGEQIVSIPDSSQNPADREIKA